VHGKVTRKVSVNRLKKKPLSLYLSSQNVCTTSFLGFAVNGDVVTIRSNIVKPKFYFSTILFANDQVCTFRNLRILQLIMQGK
jgi:hypothetical protein